MKTKRLLALLLVMFTLSTSLWAVTATIDGIKYEVVKAGKIAKVLSNSYKGNIVIPETVTYDGVVCNVTAIDNKAFYNCYNLTKVSIPDNVTELGRQTFWNCSKLVEVHLGIGITAIRFEDFRECRSLTTVNIPETVKDIEEYAFYGCSKLSSLPLPDGLETIGKDAFSSSGLTDVIMGDGMKTIGEDAYSDCKSLTKVVIGSNVTTIGSSAFFNTSLTSAKIPNNVTTIGTGVFARCSKMLSVQIGSGLTEIPKNTFSGCTELISVYIIGNNITKIGENAFYECTDLVVIKLPSSVKTIENGAFALCTKLYNLELNEGLKTISGRAFEKCTDLQEVEIPNSVTVLDDYVFSECSSLTKIWVGTGMKAIEDYAFYKCEDLVDFYCYATQPPTADESAFYLAYPEYKTLYVPAESVNTYKATSPWSSFGNIIATDGSTPQPPVLEKCAKPTITYNDGMLYFSCETPDVQFVYSIKNGGADTGVGDQAQLVSNYYVSVYATKSGYKDSDTATKTFVPVKAIKGDVNDDGKVTITDAVSVVNIILSGETSAPKMDVPQEPELMVEPE